MQILPVYRQKGERIYAEKWTFSDSGGNDTYDRYLAAQSRKFLSKNEQK